MQRPDELRDKRNELFRNLESPDTSSRFFDQVADDVRWLLLGNHPLAGEYHSKADFRRATYERLTPLTENGIQMNIEGVHIDGDIAIGEMTSRTVALDGKPYDQIYVWVCRFDGDTIVEVRAYVDSKPVYDILRLERHN
ncbi:MULTISPECIES: nuclear transport factor 2 family protein [unclassified Nonomuraea]|uniref:nuclear transport factor 2 family protein n=1 Tax=unclassified Nonomuraea TaxID=2593643 RepID=UPI003405B3E8